MHRDAGFDFILLFVLGSLSTGGGFALAVGCAAVTPCTLLAGSTIPLRPERARRIPGAGLRFRRGAGEARNVVGWGISISLHVHPLRDEHLVSGVRVWHASRCMSPSHLVPLGEKAGPGEESALVVVIAD